MKSKARTIGVPWGVEADFALRCDNVRRCSCKGFTAGMLDNATSSLCGLSESDDSALLKLGGPTLSFRGPDESRLSFGKTGADAICESTIVGR